VGKYSIAIQNMQLEKFLKAYVRSNEWHKYSCNECFSKGC